jgi:exosome complex component RRP42
MQYIAGGVKQNLRADGRSRVDWRVASGELGPVPQAAGSARFRLGGTDVIVSVKGDIGKPTLEKPLEGAVICTVDSSTVFSMNSSLGGTNEDRQMQQRNDELTVILNDILVKSGAIDLELFSLVPGKHCWVLYIDVLVLDYDGNLIDTIVMASRLAISSMRLPKVRIEEGGEATEVVLAEDVDSSRIIGISQLPVAVTIGKLGDGFLVDPSGAEETCCDAGLVIALSGENVVMMRKLGCGMLDPGLLTEYISAAQTASVHLDTLTSNCISK